MVRTAALLAWIASLGDDRVGAVIAHGAAQTRILPARARQTGVLPLLEALLQSQPRAPGQPAPLALEEALRALLPLVRPGSQILAISDFAGLRQEAASLDGARRTRRPEALLGHRCVGGRGPAERPVSGRLAGPATHPGRVAYARALAAGLGRSVRHASPPCRNTTRLRS